VGAVAIDSLGRLAAATSTGGRTCKVNVEQLTVCAAGGRDCQGVHHGVTVCARCHRDHELARGHCVTVSAGGLCQVRPA
jgi:hypothetical protein